MSVDLKPGDRVSVVRRAKPGETPPVPGSTTHRRCRGCGQPVLCAPSTERALQSGMVNVLVCWQCLPQRDSGYAFGVLPGALDEARRWGDA